MFYDRLLLGNYHEMNLKYKSSRPEVFLGKNVLKICSKFTREHPCRSAISIKLQSRTPFPKNTSRWLLLEVIISLSMDFYILFLPSAKSKVNEYILQNDINICMWLSFYKQQVY